jgi:hypothetical protein
VSDNVTPLRGRLEGAAPLPRAAQLLPKGCPVTPLGVDGTRCWFLDALGQIVNLNPQQLSRRWIAHLFAGNTDFLEEHWPRRTEIKNKETKETEWVTTGFKPEEVADALVRACAAIGVWSPFAKVRGRGAWNGADGDLVLHLGTRLWIRGQLVACGVRNGLVYPVQAARPGPHAQPQAGGPTGPAFALEQMLATWSWSRPSLDERLLLGWIAAAMLGGALHWRPACWITGDRGTGKSYLQEMLRHLFVDGEGIVSVNDTTAAGVRAAIGFDSLPVALDELEAEEDNTRVNAVITLARQAASGGTILRGSADHSGASFTARFATLYSSILIPPLRAQDRSRIAVLNLKPLARREAPVLQPEALRELGQRLLRRLADAWPMLPARLDAWRRALIERGYDARGADQFGTLLACADLALNDAEPDSDSLDDLAGRLVRSTAAERADELADWQHCLQRLASSICPGFRSGAQMTVGTVIAQAAGRRMMRDSETGDDTRAPTPQEQGDAAAMLATIGLRVLQAVPVRDEAGQVVGYREMLAVANAHAGLNALFTPSHWQARSGANGGWKQSLERCPGAQASPTGVRFRGPQQRAVLVPLYRALGEIDPEAGVEEPPA